MGLFDSLKKNLGDLTKEIENHKDDLQKEIEKFAGAVNVNNSSNNQNNVNVYENNINQDEPFYETPSIYPHPVNDGSVDQFGKFDSVISANFADYEVRKNVPASELDANCHPACTPVQFLFCKDSAPVLAVVLVKTNNYRGRNVLGTKSICDSKGIKYIRFYQEYENAEDYIIKRIRENL